MTEIDHGDIITSYVSFQAFNGGLPYEVTKHSAELMPFIGTHSSSEMGLIHDEAGKRNWEFDEVLNDFFYSLRKMGNSLNMSFPAYNRSFVLVDRKDVLKKGEHKKTIVDLYGDEIEDTAVGSRIFLPEGAFELRIGFKDREDEIEKDELMEIMAHEYGHTLGEEIPNPILEECKAFAFSFMFSGFIAGKQEGVRFKYYTPDMVSDPNFLTKWENRGVHERAQELLAALQMNGKSRSQVLADLTASRFGDCTPSVGL